MTRDILRSSGGPRLPIVGESFYQDALSRVAGESTGEWGRTECTAILRLDNTNRYDSNAIRVEVNGALVGHLSREDAVAFRRLYAAGHADGSEFECPAEIRGGARGKTVKAAYGVWLDLDL